MQEKEKKEEGPTKAEYLEALINQVNNSLSSETESLAVAFESRQELIGNQCFFKSASMDQYADCCIQRKKNLQLLLETTKLMMEFYIHQLPTCLQRNQREICRRSLILRIKDKIMGTKTDLQVI